MVQRPTITPPLTADGLTADDLRAHLRQWHADTTATRAALQGLRAQVETTSRQLENPNAAFEYLDFFDGFFSRAETDLQLTAGLDTAAFTTAHADTLRQLASNAAAEQRRTVMFRDKWVNKPLPYETVRPMLTQIAGDVRDQLQDYRELTAVASKWAALNSPPAPPSAGKPEPGLGRRELFSRLVRPLNEGLDG
jgi:hypothetical protein